MADVVINKFTTQILRDGATPSSPGFVVSEGQDPVNPPGTNNFVPYSGAISNVELGEYGLESGFITLDTTPTGTPVDQGTIYWDDSKSTAALIMNGTTQHIGQDTYFYVKNSTGSNIAKGVAVRFDGTDGASGHLKIAPFLADGTYPSAYFMGVTAEAIDNGDFGQVTNFGEIEGINTSGYSAGALLYASTTSAGAFQTTAPVAPNNIVLIAAAVNSKNNGAIIVRPTYGSNINDDEGVKIVSPTTGDLLQLQAGGLWENKTKAQVLGGTSSQFVKGDGSLDSTTYQSTAEKAQPNGYASLDSNGKVPLTQINDALLGNVNYQGLWNASTNTPTLANPPASGTKGYYYIVSTAGTFAGISFEVGDWIISNGSAWQKVDNTDAVSSVFGRTGNVVAANGDYTTAQVTESGNLYYTDGRARNSLSFAAGSGAYNTSTGVITIPTNNNQIANGAGYITSAALGAYLPLAGGTMTGVITTPNGTFGIIVGDDSRLADRNIANTLFLEGVQNNDRGYINFSQTSGNALGAINGGDLTWRGNSVVTGSASSGQVAYWSSGSAITGESELFWDSTNNQLGIGTAIPATRIEVTSGNSGSTEVQRWSYNDGNPAYSLRLRQDVTTGLVKHVFDVVNNGTTYSNNLVLDRGYVGIGTSSPSQALEILRTGGNASYSAMVSGTVDLLVGVDAAGLPRIFTAGANAISMWTNSTEQMRITSDGNIGIGTININNPEGFQKVLNISSNNAALVLSNTNGTTKNWSIGAYEDGSYRIVDANSPRLTITSGGNVGIGTTTPNLSGGSLGSSILTVSATSSERNGILELNGTRTTNTFVSGYVRFFNNGAATPLADIRAIRGSSDTSGDLAFTTADTERMRLTSGGNVLIGTATDSGGKLQVNGAIKSIVSSGGSVITAQSTATNGEAQVQLEGKNSSGTSRSATFKYDNADIVRIGTSSNIAMRFETSDTPRMTITSGGNLEMSASSDITFGGSGKGIYLSRAGLGPRASLTTRGGTTWVDVGNSSDWSGVTLAASGGNVLVGTTSNNGSRFQVNGASTFAGTGLFNSGTRNVLYVIGTVADNNYSDAIYLQEGSGQATGRQSISWFNDNIDYYKARIWTQVGSGYNATLFGIDVADDARNIDTRLAIRNGNVLIGTTTDVGAKLYVNGNIRTGALDGGYVSGYWKLGRALSGTQPSESYQIIVEINGQLYSIGAASI